MLRIGGLFLILLLIGCSKGNPIKEVLESKHTAIKTVADSLEQYEVQILYTQIDSTESGYEFTDHRFQTNPKHYFYPASTVKLPVALLAAEYVAQQTELTIDTPYSIAHDSVPHTIAKDIKHIFAISDNEAYNRNYEFLGRDYINIRLKELGLKKTRIAHRLSTPKATESTRRKIEFYPSYEGPAFRPEQSPDSPIDPLNYDSTLKGKAFINKGELVSAPMDFSLKNNFPLEDQHELMKRLFFPQEYSPKKRLQLKPSEEIRIKNMMRKLPRQAGFDSTTYYDSYGKFFMYGDTKDNIPSHIKIYNKVGYAYGTLTETAYIVDSKENIQFLLSARILVNKNGIFNDDTYQYDDIGLPFLAQLGREMYEYSLENKVID